MQHTTDEAQNGTDCLFELQVAPPTDLYCRGNPDGIIVQQLLCCFNCHFKVSTAGVMFLFYLLLLNHKKKINADNRLERDSFVIVLFNFINIILL